MVALADGEVAIVPCTERQGWKLRASALEDAITSRTRWVILNSPNNPTGAIYSAVDIKELTDVLLRHPHVLILADDIYEHTRYGTPFATPAAVEPKLRDRILTVNGVSKGYSMTGWRIGYAGGPAWLIDAMQTLQSQSTSNACSISQAAAVAALNGGTGFMSDWLNQLAARRDVVLTNVAAIDGLQCSMPEGAFYAFVNCRGLIGKWTSGGTLIGSDLDLATYLIEEAHVGVLHGSVFGAPGHLRIAYAVDIETLQDAWDQIARACARLLSAPIALAPGGRVEEHGTTFGLRID
jgi:aspartate aminotransferase